MERSVSRLGFPVRFIGSVDEIRRNTESHDWASLDGEDWRCSVCDCKPGGAVSTWPCGTDVPTRFYEQRKEGR